jgi:hypothetical protein
VDEGEIGWHLKINTQFKNKDVYNVTTPFLPEYRRLANMDPELRHNQGPEVRHDQTYPFRKGLPLLELTLNDGTYKA